MSSTASRTGSGTAVCCRRPSWSGPSAFCSRASRRATAPAAAGACAPSCTTIRRSSTTRWRRNMPDRRLPSARRRRTPTASSARRPAARLATGACTITPCASPITANSSRRTRITRAATSGCSTTSSRTAA